MRQVDCPERRNGERKYVFSLLRVLIKDVREYGVWTCQMQRDRIMHYLLSSV